MLSSKRRIMRTLALALVLALVTPILAACNVVDTDPVVLKVGDVTMHYSQFASICEANASSYSSMLSSTEGLVAFQDAMFEYLKQYAMLLYQAHQQDLELDEDELAEVQEMVDSDMESLTKGYAGQVSEEGITEEILTDNGYTATQEEIDAALEEAMASDLADYKNQLDSDMSDEEKTEEAKAMMQAEYEANGDDYEAYVAEKTEEANFKALWNKYAQDEAVKLRDEYITGTLNMSVSEYEESLYESYKESKLVEKMEQKIRDGVTLEDGDAREWYDEQVKTLTEKYEEDTSGYYAAQSSYDAKSEDDVMVQPLVVPDGYIRVKHILLSNPEETEEAASDTEPVADETADPEDAVATLDPDATAVNNADATEPAETEGTVDATEPAETEEAAETTDPEATEAAEETTDPEATEAADETADPEAAEAAEEGTEEPAEELTTTVSQELIDEVQEKIDAIDPNADKLEAFDQLIALYNEDPGMSTEPYSTSGYLVSESIIDQYTEGFAEAALELENVGDISAPVITEYGVHFIQLIEKVEAKTVSFEDAQEEIEAYVLAEKQDEAVEATVAEWAETLPVTEWTSRIRRYSPSNLGSSSISIG